MVTNIHKNMELGKIWYKPNEHKRLINALEENNKEEVLNIVFEIYLRGDLWI